MLEFVQVTAQYSNVVLVAILPHVSDFAQKLDLPIPQPIDVTQISRFTVDPRLGHVGGSLVLTNGMGFMFDRGHVTLFATPKSFYRLQDPDRVPEFYGKVNMDEDSAVALVRGVLSKFKGSGIKELIAKKPKVVSPPVLGENVLARYRIQWMMPNREQWPWVDVEVDASSKTIQMMALLATNFWLESPKIDVVPRVISSNASTSYGGNRLTPVSAAYSNALVAEVLPLATDFARKLELPLPTPLTLGMVDHAEVGLIEGEPIAYIVLTNDFKFLFEHGSVCSFGSPDCFFAPSFEMHSKTYDDFIAPVVMTEDEMIEMGRAAVKKLGYTDKQFPFLTGKASLAGGPGRKTKPDMARFYFQWDESTRENPYPPPLVGFEIDASTRTLKSLTINHTNAWRHFELKVNESVLEK